MVLFLHTAHIVLLKKKETHSVLIQETQYVRIICKIMRYTMQLKC